ncbi:MAG: hypothetical protein AAGD35_08875 [Actinomycetota bacterium]
MNISDEQDLRNRAADLVLAWYGETRGSLDDAGPREFLELVEAASVTLDESTHVMQRWVDASRRAGLTWNDIGTTLGISRQAAQKRFGHGEAPVVAAPFAPVIPTEGELVERRGMTAFNEIEALAEEGRAGRELVDAGFSVLRFRQTGHPWEYRRVVALRRSRVRQAMEADGWAHALSWPPYQYFKRPLTD